MSDKERRLDGYYIGFESTGNAAVDKILGAVACAGKAFHHTTDWTEDIEDYYYDDHTGGSAEAWIQNAAIEAAAHIAELERQLAERSTLTDEEIYKIRFRVASMYSAHVNSPLVGAHMDGYRAALEAGKDE